MDDRVEPQAGGLAEHGPRPGDVDPNYRGDPAPFERVDRGGVHHRVLTLQCCGDPVVFHDVTFRKGEPAEADVFGPSARTA
jgi:hypothetical protein